MGKMTRVTLKSGVAVGGTAENQMGPYRGKVIKIGLKYDAGSGAGTHVGIWGGRVNTDVADTDAEGFLFITGNTDAVHYPRNFVTDTTGEQGSIEYADGKDVNEEFAIFENIHIKILNATEGKGVTAEILVEEN